MPKLFNVSAIGKRGDTETYIVVANTEEEARDRILSNADSYIYNAYPNEITEVDGYKVVFKKGKKIVLESS